MNPYSQPRCRGNFRVLTKSSSKTLAKQKACQVIALLAPHTL
jgi:hypothetical protein